MRCSYTARIYRRRAYVPSVRCGTTFGGIAVLLLVLAVRVSLEVSYCVVRLVYGCGVLLRTVMLVVMGAQSVIWGG